MFSFHHCSFHRLFFLIKRLDSFLGMNVSQSLRVVIFSWNCWLRCDIVIFFRWRLVNVTLCSWLIYLFFGWWLICRLLGFDWLNRGFLDFLSDRSFGFRRYDTNVRLQFFFLPFLPGDLRWMIKFNLWIFWSFLSIINIVFLLNWLNYLSNNWFKWLCCSWFLGLNDVFLGFWLDNLLWSLLFCWGQFHFWLLCCLDTWPLINDWLDVRFSNLRVVLRLVAFWLPFGRRLVNIWCRLLLFLIGRCDVLSWRLYWRLYFSFGLVNVDWSPWILICIDLFLRLFCFLFDHRSRRVWFRLLLFYNNWLIFRYCYNFLDWLFLYLVR